MQRLRVMRYVVNIFEVFQHIASFAESAFAAVGLADDGFLLEVDDARVFIADALVAETLVADGAGERLDLVVDGGLVFLEERFSLERLPAFGAEVLSVLLLFLLHGLVDAVDTPRHRIR